MPLRLSVDLPIVALRNEKGSYNVQTYPAPH